MRELQTYMPGEVTTYDWGDQATAIQQGQGGQVLTWSESFPAWDDPSGSQVSGLVRPAVPTAALELRSRDQAGFEETPEVGHQGGSAYCLSRYSKQVDAGTTRNFDVMLQTIETRMGTEPHLPQ
jgi:multiple sugar transport system substrate-binding protein